MRGKADSLYNNSMEYRIYKEEDFNIMGGPAGEERQLAAFPQQQPFLWKLALQEFDQEETELARMPEYDRIMLVLEGDIILAYEGQRVARLKALEQDRFDGGFSAKSFGKAQVYDLLVRKGAAGYLDVLKLTEESRVPEREDPEGKRNICQAFYCQEGYGVVSAAGQICMIRPGQQLVICQNASEELDTGIMGEGTLIRAQIFYDCEEGTEPDQCAAEADQIEISDQPEDQEAEPEVKGSLSDFLECMKLSLTNFRGSRFIFPYLKKIWYDEALKAGIRKVERFYLPMLLWFAGVAVFGMYGAEQWKPLTVLYILIGWSLLVMFVLSPLMYFLAVPKPVKAHIKKLEDLTEYEKGVRQQEQDANPVADKILKKYKISGRNEYIEDDRPKRRKKPRK